ncbi:MAG: hypothetical protein IJW69_02145 [Clostridia bacterium]|nr:hypothetical protein [Clostridia bacterium]
MGRRPTPRKLLKKLDQNLYRIGLCKLRVILERIIVDYPLAEPHAQKRKRALFSALWAFGDATLLALREEFKMTCKTPLFEVFADFKVSLSHAVKVFEGS